MTTLNVGDMELPVDTWEQLIADIQSWQRVQFPHATPASTAKHLLKEANELVKEPTDAEEVADIIHMAIANAHVNGHDLLLATRVKFNENLRRQWGKPDADGVVEHVR